MLTASPHPQLSERVQDWPAFALLDEPGVRSLNAFFCELTSTRELHDALRLVTEQVRSFLAARFIAVMIFEDEGQDQFAQATESGSISLPLSTGGRTIGQITIYLDHAEQLSPSQARVMEVICAIAAVTLDNARRLQRDRKRLRQAEVVADLVPAILTVQTPHQAARLAAMTLHDKLHYDVVRVLWRQDGSDDLQRVSIPVRTGASELERSCQDTGAALKVLREGTPVLVADVLVEDWQNCRTKPMPLRSLICVPISRGRTTIGVLDVGGRSPRAFDSTDMETLSSLANTLAAILGRLSTRKSECAEPPSDQEVHKADLISMIAHDVRGPLSLVKGYASTLLRIGDSSDSEKRRRFLMGISEAADRMSDMVDQLSHLSRLTSGRFQPKMQQLDLISLVFEVVERARPQIGNHRITVEMPGGTLLVEADVDHLSQAISYLVINAALRSPSDGRIVVRVGSRGGVHGDSSRLSQPPHVLEAERFGVVEVVDEGPCVPPDQIEKLFEKPYRVKSSDGRNRGLGLELYAAKRILEAHGGPIWVENGLSKGSSFCFGVPVSIAGQGTL